MKNTEKIKATMILINSWGAPIARKIWLKKYEVKKDGFKKKLSVWYTEKGKRKTTGTRFDFDDVVLAKGWQDVKGAINTGDDIFTSFEAGMLNKMKAQLIDIIEVEEKS